jgi:hypothetical protein
MNPFSPFRFILPPALLCCFVTKAFAQKDSAWVLRFTAKNTVFNPGKNDYQPGRKGFYLYENCIYDVVLKNDMVYNARVLQLKKDSLIFTTHANLQNAINYHEHFDTLTISPSAIKKIRLLGDRIMALYGNVHLRNYYFEFLKDTVAKRMAADTLTDTASSIKYLVTPYITAQGINNVYTAIDTFNKKKYIPDTLIAPVVAIQDTIFRKRNYIWFLPFNAHRVNGISLGVHTGSIKGKPLKINGVNINADIPAMFLSMFLVPHLLDAASVKRLSDTLDTDGQVSINGLSASGGGIIMGKKLSGLFVNGGICQSGLANGIFITGGFNYFQSVKGISIGGLRNSAIKCTGIQIGFINCCKHLKGLQLGLWNVNSKRKMPFINWGT